MTHISLRKVLCASGHKDWSNVGHVIETRPEFFPGAFHTEAGKQSLSVLEGFLNWNDVSEYDCTRILPYSCLPREGTVIPQYPQGTGSRTHRRYRHQGMLKSFV